MRRGEERLGIGYKDLICGETGERLREETFAQYRKTPTTKGVIYTALTENAVEVAVANPLTINHDYQ